MTNQCCICIQIYPKTETFCQILYMSRRQLFNSINFESKYLKVDKVSGHKRYWRLKKADIILYIHALCQDSPRRK